MPPVPVPPLSLDNLSTPPTADDWNTALLNLAATIGLPTTTWEAGGVERAVFATFANALQLQGISAAIIAQAGFLDFAATGSVTYTDATGAVVTLYITPDPSIPAQNPTGALGWLDVLADSVYDVRRILATPAGGAEALVNSSGSTYGPFAPGTYHVAQPLAAGSPGYTNTASLTIPPSAHVGGDVFSIGNSAGLILVTTNAPHGLVNGDIVFITGAPAPTGANNAWIVTVTSPSAFTLNGSIFVAGGVVGFVFAPTIAAFTADSAGTASNARPRTATQAITSLIGVSVSNPVAWLGSNVEGNVALAARCRLKLASVSPNGPKGAYAFYALSSITIGPKMNPPHLVAMAINRALVQGGGGSVTVTIANAAGAPTPDDVDSTDAVIQAFAVPASDTETTVAAAEHAVTIATKAWVRAADVARFQPVAQAAVQLYFAALAIGGVTNTGGVVPNTNVVPIDAVIGAVFDACAAAGIVVQQIEATLNGFNANVQLLLGPPVEVATLANPTFVPVVTGV